jgi:D-serine dehydratase
MTAYDDHALRQALQSLRQRAIDPVEKGFTALGPITPADLVARKVSLRGGDLTFPLMVLRGSALANNVAAMAAWCKDRGVELAPHGKTSMSPEITARQLAAGAWGITAATIGQARAFVASGVRRVLLANQLVDPAGIRWLASAISADPGLSVIGYLDSREAVTVLDAGLTSAGMVGRLPVLVELGIAGRRTGARTIDDVVAVARSAHATGTLKVVGATGYEGVLGHSRSEAELAEVAAFCRQVRALGLRLLDEGLVDPAEGLILSAGGSTYFDVVADELAGEPATVVLRSGGYVTHDDGLYAHSTPLPTGGSPYELRAALEVWAHVVSRPEPGRALVCAGRRDLPFDVDLPFVHRLLDADGVERPVDGVVVSSLNDQHAFLDLPTTSGLAVGDQVCFGISHPCTAFDKWRLVPVVDDDDVIVDVAHTLF